MPTEITYESISTILNHLQQNAWQTSEEKGWHELDVRPAERIALMHSELSEALEELRNGHAPNEVYFPSVTKTTRCDDGISVCIAFDNSKPEGFPVELADCFIRILDTCQIYGINLAEVTLQKMAYNATRPIRHGGKTL